MFLSWLSDIVEPRDRTEKASLIFKQIKIHYQKIEILALVIDLLLMVLASTCGSTVSRHIFHENSATTKVCLDSGVINSLLYIYVVSMRGLHRLPVLLMPLPYVSLLLAIFAPTAFL